MTPDDPRIDKGGRLFQRARSEYTYSVRELADTATACAATRPRVPPALHVPLSSINVKDIGCAGVQSLLLLMIRKP
jgi:hypothetical protein